MKPRIRLLASGRRTSGGMELKWTQWVCSGGGYGMFNGYGPTPADAYECWLNQEIPF